MEWEALNCWWTRNRKNWRAIPSRLIDTKGDWWFSKRAMFISMWFLCDVCLCVVACYAWIECAILLNREQPYRARSNSEPAAPTSLSFYTNQCTTSLLKSNQCHQTTAIMIYPIRSERFRYGPYHHRSRTVPEYDRNDDALIITETECSYSDRSSPKRLPLWHGTYSRESNEQIEEHHELPEYEAI